MTTRTTISPNEPLTKAQALSLRRSNIKLSPAQRAVLEGTTDEEWNVLEDEMQNMTLECARRLEGHTPREVRKLLLGELDADEIRDLLDYGLHLPDED